MNYQNTLYVIAIILLIPGVICNGTAISPQNITIPSSNNHVVNSKMAEVPTNAVVQHVSTKPSPTESL